VDVEHVSSRIIGYHRDEGVSTRWSICGVYDPGKFILLEKTQAADDFTLVSEGITPQGQSDLKMVSEK
jgi:hypothetical protein